MSLKIKSFVPPLAEKFRGAAGLPKGPPPFIPPLAAKLTPPIRPAPAAMAIPDRLNLKQAAKYLGISAPTMRKLATSIPHLCIGRVRRFDRGVLDDFLHGRASRYRAA